MYVVFVGFFNIITKVVLHGSGIFLIIMLLLHQIFLIYQQFPQNLKKEQHQYVFCHILLIIQLLIYIYISIFVQFRPLEQLMSVFPAASSKHVPQPWAILMSDPVIILF